MLIVIIILVVLFVGFIECKKEDMENERYHEQIMPPNYRSTPWTEEWVRPYYYCDGCEHGHLRRCIDGEFKGYCTKYDMFTDYNRCVCDDYLEFDSLSAWRDSEHKFIPFKGHFDHCPYQDK